MSGESLVPKKLKIWTLLTVLLCFLVLISSLFTMEELRNKSETLIRLEKIQSLLELANLELRLDPWTENPSTGVGYQNEFDSLLKDLERTSRLELAFLRPIQRDQSFLRPEAGGPVFEQPIQELSGLRKNMRDELPRLETWMKSQLGFCAILLFSLLAQGVWIFATGKQKRASLQEKEPEETPFASLPLSFTEVALKAQRPEQGKAGISARGYTERVLQSLSNLLILTGRDGNIQMTNDAVTEALGYTRGELLGRQLNEILAGDSPNGAHPLGEFETDFMAKDGTKIPVQVSCSAVFGDDKEVDGLVIVAKDITERKQTERLIRVNEARLRNLTERLVSAREDERQRVARDLHDGMLQSVIATELQMNSALRKWKKKLKEEEPKSLQYGLECLKEAVAQGRRLIHDLRPPTLDQFGLVKSIRHEASKFGKLHGIKVHFQAPKDDTQFPQPLETAFHNIFQECLSNILKHSQTKAVDASLEVKGKWVVLTVEDHGRGFDQATVKRGIGLDSMRERAELLGGTLSVKSVPGEGTKTVARIPLQSSTC